MTRQDAHRRLTVPQQDARHRGFTLLQSQYLAFIRPYTVIHRVPPAEADMRAESARNRA